MPAYHIQFTNGDNTEVVTDKPLLIDERTVRADADGVPFWCPIERVQFIKMTQADYDDEMPLITRVVKDTRDRVTLLERQQFTPEQRKQLADIIDRLRAKGPTLPDGI